MGLRYIRILEAVRTIQRYIRGFLCWKYADNIKSIYVEYKNLKFFDYHATLIQKYFRGFYFRKYVHSYYHRKKCLHNIEIQDAKVLSQIKQYQEDQMT